MGGSRSAVIVGGGIGGLAAAVALQNEGWSPLVLERAPGNEPLGAGLTLWPNAVRALGLLGLADALRGCAVPGARGGVFTSSGSPLLVMNPDDLLRRYGDPCLAVHRAELHAALLAVCGDVVRWGAEVVAVERADDHATVILSDGTRIAGDLVVGADGVGSRVRTAVLPSSPLRHTGHYAWRAVLETPLADHDAPATVLEPPAGRQGPVGELWGPGAVFGVVPLSGRRVYWFGTTPLREGDGGDPEGAKRLLLEHFRSWHPVVTELISGTAADGILRHELTDRAPQRGWSSGRVTLLGDAAHAMTPHLGQGACQAIEDAVVLGEELAGGRVDVPAALSAYERRRFRRSASVVRQARLMGWVAQWDNAPARRVRDAVLPRVPAALRMRALDPLLRLPTR